MSITKRPQRTAMRFFASFAGTLAVMYLLLFVNLPFYIYKPGTAENIRPMISLPVETPEDQGVFMLTTVSMLTRSNLLSMIIALADPHAEIRRKQDVLRGKSEEEYSQTQEYVMLGSQSNALQAAYTYAGIPFVIDQDGVMVLETVKGMPSEAVLKGGDYIVKVDDKDIHTSKDLYEVLGAKKAGDTVELSYQRKGVAGKVELTLGTLASDSSGTDAAPRAGIGVRPADVLKVKAEDESKQVTIKAGEIGGPSAGLMFTLEIINRLEADDIAKGYRIAGTGSITPEGAVCPIGGVQHKIVAAHKEKADIFFVPADMPQPPAACGPIAPTANATDAAAEAKGLGTTMKIIPVATVDDAMNYLHALPPKAS
ncbi:SepM family pheromone-processing serine protease [Paenibacillus sp. y28]|uniref:SepM family pheromone-processing serine protease n=1 Tax=Paenibacillus sp. y28 TaxID=3129110 RepID=UPI0030198991